MTTGITIKHFWGRHVGVGVAMAATALTNSTLYLREIIHQYEAGKQDDLADEVLTQ